LAGCLVLNNIKLNDRHLRLIPFMDETIEKMGTLSCHPSSSCCDGAYGGDASFCARSERLRPIGRMTSFQPASCCLIDALPF